MSRHPDGRGPRTWRFARALPVVACLAATVVQAQNPGEAAAVFATRCSSCHTIGDGTKVGPDLLGVMDRRDEAWLTKFLKGPGALIDAGDPVAKELFSKANGIRMPDPQLSEAERKALFALFQECTRKGGCKPSAGPRRAEEATPEEIERGHRLFEGEEAFSAGGPSCLGCHDVRGAGVLGGGTIGSNLTFVHARLGEKRLAPLISEMPSPLMKSIYGRAPLKDDEQYAIRAYLANVSRDGTPPRKDRDFLYLGVVGMLVALGFIGIVRGGTSHGNEGET